MKTGVLRNEDQKSAVRSLREYLDTVKQKRLPKDSTSSSEAVTGKEKDATSRTNLTPVPVTGSSVAPNLTTITEVGQGDEDSQGLPMPKLQRLASEENQSVSSAVSGISTATTAGSTASSTAGTNDVGGDVGGAEEMGVVTTTKGQEVVGGALPNSTGSVLPTTPHSATSTNQFEPSNLLIAKRSDTAPALTTAAQANRAPSSEPVPSSAQSALGATSQSNIHTTPDHQNTASPEDERKTTSRTNSNESEKGSQNQAISGLSPDKKLSVGSEGLPQVLQKEATSVQSSSSSTIQTSSSRSLVIPVGPAEGSVGGGGRGGGMSRASSEESATATPTNPPPTTSMLQPHELAGVQSEHSTESMSMHSQGSLESASASAISSQEQLSSQEVKGDKEKLSIEKGTNGTLKKKGQRGKSKQIKLNLVEMTDEKVVKCALVTGTGQMVNFQFSIKYDKPLAIFQKLVSLFYQYILLMHCNNASIVRDLPPNIPIVHAFYS